MAAVGTTLLAGRPRLATQWAEGLHLRDANDLRTLLGWGLAVHDIGKFCDRFQALSPSRFAQLWPGRPPRTYNPHHTTLGSLLIQRVVQAELTSRLATDHPWSARDWRDVLAEFEPAFTGHHGRPPEVLGSTYDIWDDEGARVAAAWLRTVEELFPLGELWRDARDPREVMRAIRAASWHLAGFAVLSDWLGSNEPAFFREGPRDVHLHFATALARARELVASAGVLPAMIAPPWTMPDVFGHPPTHLQSVIQDWRPAGQHLLVIEESTGSGKTEAALLAAHRLMASGEAEGLYFALPTQATANAMYARLQKAGPRLFEDPGTASLALAHSGKLAMRAFRDVATAGWPTARGASAGDGRLACAAWLADSRKKAFLAHLGVGTLDQALLGVLRVRHQSLRLFGLTSRVLVVDEVHAYDHYAAALLERLLRFHARAGGSAILMSATLPRSMRERLAHAFAEEANMVLPHVASDEYPLFTDLSARGLAETALRSRTHRTIEVRFLHSEEEVESLLRDAHERGAASCWIRNTVAEAIRSADRLHTLEATVFHARFIESDRRSIEQSVLRWAGPDSQPSERAGRVLVATQVVEQSLDLDFDVLVTDLAPVELVLQRAGRLQRHDRRERPTAGTILYVHAPRWSDAPTASHYASWSQGTAAVYRDHGRLWLGERALRQGTIRLPQDSRLLVEAAFGDDARLQIPLELRTSTEEAEGQGLALAATADLGALPLHDGYSASAARWEAPERVRTRAGEPSVDLYLARQGPASPIPLGEESDGWEGARVSVRLSQAIRADLISEQDGSVPSGRSGPLPDNLVLLEAAPGGGWQRDMGKARVHYSRDRGLTIGDDR